MGLLSVVPSPGEPAEVCGRVLGVDQPVDRVSADWSESTEGGVHILNMYAMYNEATEDPDVRSDIDRRVLQSNVMVTQRGHADRISLHAATYGGPEGVEDARNPMDLAASFGRVFEYLSGAEPPEAPMSPQEQP